MGRTPDQVNITVSKETRDWLKAVAESEGVSVVALLDSWREAGGGGWRKAPGGAVPGESRGGR